MHLCGSITGAWSLDERVDDECAYTSKGAQSVGLDIEVDQPLVVGQIYAEGGQNNALTPTTLHRRRRKRGHHGLIIDVLTSFTLGVGAPHAKKLETVDS